MRNTSGAGVGGLDAEGCVGLVIFSAAAATAAATVAEAVAADVAAVVCFEFLIASKARSSAHATASAGGLISDGRPETKVAEFGNGGGATTELVAAGAGGAPGAFGTAI